MSARPDSSERAAVLSEPRHHRADAPVASWLVRMAAVSWRLLVVAAAGWVVIQLLIHLQLVVVPLIIGLFFAAVLGPPAAKLVDRGWKPLLATWSVLLVALGLSAALGWFLAPAMVDGFAEVGGALSDAYDDISTWLVEGPLGLDPSTVAEAESAIGTQAKQFAQTGLASRATLVFEIVAGIFLTLVITFFYVKDGRRMRDWALAHVPADMRGRTARSLERGWEVLRRYLLGVLVVGVADAALIGLGLVLIGVPFILPIMVLTLFGAFFPLVGGLFAGAVATLIALASGGAGDALLVVALTVAVQQVDGDVIAPLVYSRAVDLHPLGILLALTAGGVLAGILGAFLAVPVLAVSLAVYKTWTGEMDDHASPSIEPAA